MNKKTFFKISATALILGVSIALSVKYSPAVALAIKSGGVIASSAPLVAFAVFTIIALASAVAFIKFVVSAIRSKDTKSKPNGVSGEPRSEGQSLVQEKGKVVPDPTPPLLPHVTEELTSSTKQQPSDSTAAGTEVPQPETDDGVVVNSADESLNSLPYPSSPLNSTIHSQPLPAPPSDANHPVQNYEQQDGIPIPEKIKIALPAFERGREAGQRKRAAMIRALIPLIHSPSNDSIDEENQKYRSLPINQTMPYPNSLCRTQSLHNLVQTPTLKQQNVEEELGEQEIQTGYNSTMMDNFDSWGTNWDSRPSAKQRNKRQILFGWCENLSHV